MWYGLYKNWILLLLLLFWVNRNWQKFWKKCGFHLVSTSLVILWILLFLWRKFGLECMPWHVLHPVIRLQFYLFQNQWRQIWMSSHACHYKSITGLVCNLKLWIYYLKEIWNRSKWRSVVNSQGFIFQFLIIIWILPWQRIIQIELFVLYIYT